MQPTIAGALSVEQELCLRAGRVRLPGYGGCAKVKARGRLWTGGFAPQSGTRRLFRAGVAQLVEHLICNQRVGGSNPFVSSINTSRHWLQTAW